ncbi:glutathione S-transferase N-terminal domain-containing protein [Orrella sp. 11846]|uniref:glutathione S-transferase N-terminal domain-containing protein n=1 Tax=Orrella sp. 11846 TaxID=3409913 RepID=UPI003B5BF467
MIDFYCWPTPNGQKIALFLEETGLPYTIHPINIGKDEQFQPSFLEISPNNRIPAIVDHEPTQGGGPVSVFESGAILMYLAEKTGKFTSTDWRKRLQISEWLFWQMGGLGPMAGQNHHFGVFASERIPYAIDRYVKETARLYGVLNKRLEGREFIVDEYSIADMACFPWVNSYERQQQDLDDFPNLARWFDAIASRPATQRVYEIGQTISEKATPLNRR